MLATLTDEPFSDPEWIFEPKLDGIRILTYRHGTRVHLYSRNRKDRTAAYPELAAALARLAGDDFVIDGEVVAMVGEVSSFARLQGRMGLLDEERASGSGIDVTYYVFDVLYVNGHDTTALPLRERKALLRRALRLHRPMRLVDHRDEQGEAYYEEACAARWEGLIAKRASSLYVPGRSREWLKLKCSNEQEFVIGGFTDPQRSRVGLGALLVGVYDDGALRYAGKVGTGFDHATLERLRARLGRIERKTPPFADRHLPRKGIHWVTPSLVCQVGFTEWTEAGRLRHPRFLGLRDDKDPSDVVREGPS